jgi:hypothetical protein
LFDRGDPAGVLDEGAGVKVFHPFPHGPVRAGHITGLHRIPPFLGHGFYFIGHGFYSSGHGFIFSGHGFIFSGHGFIFSGHGFFSSGHGFYFIGRGLFS